MTEKTKESEFECFTHTVQRVSTLPHQLSEYVVTEYKALWQLVRWSECYKQVAIINSPALSLGPLFETHFRFDYVHHS